MTCNFDLRLFSSLSSEFKQIKNILDQCFSSFVRSRPGKFFFHKTWARSEQIYS